MRARKVLAVLALVAVLGLAGNVLAAPVSTNATLSVSIQGLAPITTTGPGGTVDVVGNTVMVAAGLVSLGAGITIPVTGVSAVNSLVVTKLSNLSATFSLAGVTAQAPGEVCGTGPAANVACNQGGGIGGSMALTGTVFVHVVPNIVVIPVNLNAARIGQGGIGAGAFTTEAALWSTGAGRVNTGAVVSSSTGAPAPFTVVTPTFISALGNLLPVFASFTLTNVAFAVPEAGTLLLVAAGFFGLARLGNNGRR